MADGGRIVQKVRRSITPFLDNGFLNTTRIMFGVDTDFFGDLDTVWLGNKSEKQFEKLNDRKKSILNITIQIIKCFE